ncbi:MAG: VWD domain-containing protein [Bacteroidota bacterium]
MKRIYLLLALSLGFSAVVVAQDRLSKDFQPIKTELVAWDQIRGAWLANSMDSMMRGKQIPDRTFPENFTPTEMYKVVPNRYRDFISDYALKQRIASGQENVNAREWERLNQVVQVANCKPTSGRSYGDPHLVSFDGESYSFQTVGEFVLAGSTNSDFLIQTRQKAVSENFSLNMAVAMNIGGDRVGIYVDDNPANCGGAMSRSNSPVIINSVSVEIENGTTYFLSRGGTIARSGSNYTITWPTGEKLVAGVSQQGNGNGFINCTVEVYPCVNSYYGLLGNANGRGSDDFDVNGMRTPPMLAFSTFGNQSANRGTNIAEKEYLAFLARDFGRQHRITQEASLFDYCGGRNTLSFTDERFPMVHVTLDDLSPNQQSTARQNCRDRGVSEIEMRGCIFDQAYIALPPSPRPTISDPTVNYVPKPLDRAIVNANPKPTPQPLPMTVKPIQGTKGDAPKPSIRPDLLEEPSGKKPSKEQVPVTNEPSKEVEAVPSTKPTQVVNEEKEPAAKPVIISKPAPEKPTTKPSIQIEQKPKPETSIPSAPTPVAPKPKVISSPTIKGGK